jgi:hypothetical protein
MKLLRIIRFIVLQVYSLFVRTKKRIIFIPNLLSAQSFVDIENYTAENVLTFLHFLTSNKNFVQKKTYKYILVVYQKYQMDIPVPLDSAGLPLYEKILYQQLLSPGLTFFEYIRQTFYYYYYYFSAQIIITGDPLGVEWLKKKNQVEVDLSYYVPFKSDLLRKPKRISNIDYVICGSNIAAQIDTLASNVSFEKYIPLGLPKWENLLYPRYSKEQLCSYIPYLTVDSKIIVYTPTHRDYERKGKHIRGVLGFSNDYGALNQLLNNNNAYLILKLHGNQNITSIDMKQNYSNIKYYEDTRNYTLYDILPYTDLLIADYTSTYFDYLLLNKPVLFNFYDIKKYKVTRGLSWEPVESICAGTMIYTYEQFVEQIDLFLQGKYEYDIKKAEWIKSLVLANNDNNIMERIYDFILSNGVK